MATFTNRAFLTYNNITTGSNVVSGELLEAVTVTKTAVTGEYTLGDRLTYVIGIRNTGATALSGLTVTDTLGTYEEGGQTLAPLVYVDGSLTYFVNGVPTATPEVTDTAPLTVTGIGIPPGGDAILVYSADVTAFAPLAEGGTVTNTATVTGAGIATPVTATETVTAAVTPALTITKSISPPTVTGNSRLTYTFTVQNYGSRAVVATDNATVTDTFQPILSELVVTLDGVTLGEGTDYTYNAATGEFATVPSRITVPAATFSRDPVTGAVVTAPGTAVLTVTGTV